MRFPRAFSSMLEVGKPVICVINGPAMAAAPGWRLSVMVVASPKARFAQPESLSVFFRHCVHDSPFLVWSEDGSLNWCSPAKL